jgi:hypothetical protein
MKQAIGRGTCTRATWGRRLVLATTLILLGLGQARAAEWPAYRLEATLDPATQRLAMQAEVAVGDPGRERTLEFVLGANFTITRADPPVEVLSDAAARVAFSGINGSSAALAAQRGVAAYRLRLPPGRPSFVIEYSGPVDTPPTASPEEYARSFAETPGVVSAQGVYLAGSTLWYPQLAGDHASALLTFELSASVPPQWHLIAPGNGVSAGADGRARWNSVSAVDEITLAGGPLTPYRRQAGRIEAQVYLREADPALAARYLDATSRYLRMYEDLIGPYPYDKFALVENFWETGYGMPSYTLLGPQIIRFPFILNSSYPHEILHNWWGNSVYVDYDSGNWCEGLTAYLADHLMKEIEGQGAAYRRDTLKRYRDFAAVNADFPLREFRSRHSAATEAVGYGKTLMGFHMLRQRVGDDTFRRALAAFYREFRGTRARFADVRSIFERESGLDLGRFFDEWTQQTGAADLAVEATRARGTDGRHVVSGVIRQRQPRAFDLAVPLLVMTDQGPVTTTVASTSGATPFRIETPGTPLALAVDPQFDLFRILDPRETAPSLGLLFGAAEVLAVVPAANAAPWQELLAAWKSPANRITVRTDAEIGVLPADTSVWLLGRENRLATGLFAADPTLGLAVDAEGVSIGSQRHSFAGHSHVLTRRHPADPRLAVAWITADPPGALPGLARKLPHYGKYSWLAFAGSEPANIAKGEWPATDSPLVVRWGEAPADPAAVLPRRMPLAQPPAAFSAERLMNHVRYLAVPEREGRGFGSAGLDAAANYIRDQFAAAGLEPAGGGGSFFQDFTARGGANNEEHTLRNVVGVLRGHDPRFRDQAAIVSAHYDHLGFGWPGARAEAVGKMHPGADDNASGVAVLIELAHALAGGPPPPRTMVFVAFSGEEAGLLGSRHFLAHPVPTTAANFFGIVNMDTVGRLGEQPVSILATESAREWPFVFRGITAVTGIPTRAVAGASESSDQRVFIDAGIPGVQLFTGATLDYHRPSDSADKVDGAGLVRVATVAAEAIAYLASTEKRLTAVAPAPGSTQAPGPERGPARRVSLGTIPDFAFQGPGLRIDGVVPQSPAEKAGLQAGDVLTHLGGEPIVNLGSYNTLLKRHQPGDTVEIRWLRDGEPAATSVTLTER